jgi:hypothetical protein
VPTKQDNDEERVARIERFLEQYKAKIDGLHQQGLEHEERVREILRPAKARLSETHGLPHKKP